MDPRELLCHNVPKGQRFVRHRLTELNDPAIVPISIQMSADMSLNTCLYMRILKICTEVPIYIAIAYTCLHMSMYVCIHMSTHMCIHMSRYMSMGMSTHMSVHMSVHLSPHMS